MEDLIIIGLIVVIVALCVFMTVRRIRNKSCCSGGGSKTLVERKILTDPVIMKKTIFIEGMHCDNCKSAVERALNRMDGVLCKVNLRKKCAVVEMSAEVSDEVLKAAVEELDFAVTGITLNK